MVHICKYARCSARISAVVIGQPGRIPERELKCSDNRADYRTDDDRPGAAARFRGASTRSLRTSLRPAGALPSSPFGSLPDRAKAVSTHPPHEPAATRTGRVRVRAAPATFPAAAEPAESRRSAEIRQPGSSAPLPRVAVGAAPLQWPAKRPNRSAADARQNEAVVERPFSAAAAEQDRAGKDSRNHERGPAERLPSRTKFKPGISSTNQSGPSTVRATVPLRKRKARASFRLQPNSAHQAIADKKTPLLGRARERASL